MKFGVRFRRAALLAPLFLLPLFLPAASYASTGACSDDGHACATYYPSGNYWNLQDTSCDGDYVFLVYWTSTTANTRVENHNGCGSTKKVPGQFPAGAQTVYWYVCHNKSHWPDSCSSTIVSSI